MVGRSPGGDPRLRCAPPAPKSDLSLYWWAGTQLLGFRNWSAALCLLFHFQVHEWIAPSKHLHCSQAACSQLNPQHEMGTGEQLFEVGVGTNTLWRWPRWFNSSGEVEADLSLALEPSKNDAWLQQRGSCRYQPGCVDHKQRRLVPGEGGSCLCAVVLLVPLRFHMAGDGAV